VDLSFSFAQAVALVACAAILVVAGRGLPARTTGPAVVVGMAAFGWWTGSVAASAVVAAVLCLANLVGIVGRQLHEVQHMADTSAPASNESPTAASTTPHRPWSNPHRLTPREVEVLTLVAEGRTNDEIAASLHVSMATVKSHVNRIFAKAQVETRAQAVAYAYETSLVAPPTTG